MLLSAHRVIELMVRQAQVRTERIVHCALSESLSEERRRILDGLLELKPDGDVTW
jgi:hypothetical protein